MKAKRKLVILLILSLFIMAGSGCRVHQPHYHKKGMIISTRPGGKMSPGKMKKAMGEKSAKAYAPGHNKNSKAYAHGNNKQSKAYSPKKNKHYRKRK